MKDSSSSTLIIYYQNVKGLNTLVNNVLIASSLSDYDFFVLSETWLEEGLLSGELFDHVLYDVIRDDRSHKYNNLAESSHGGGLLIALKSIYSHEEISLQSIKTSFPYINIVAVTVSFHSNMINLIALYIPLNVSTQDFCLFTNALEDFCIYQAIQSSLVISTPLIFMTVWSR